MHPQGNVGVQYVEKRYMHRRRKQGGEGGGHPPIDLAELKVWKAGRSIKILVLICMGHCCTLAPYNSNHLPTPVACINRSIR